MNRTDSLALFVKAVDTGSLSGAARALGLSLPSASRHITALEERIGTRLVIRTTRSLALTEAGRIYYEHAKQILAHLDEVEANLLADAAVPSGKVSGSIVRRIWSRRDKRSQHSSKTSGSILPARAVSAQQNKVPATLATSRT